MKQILIIQPSFPGDVVLTIPLLHAIRQLDENAKCTFLGTPVGCEIIRGIRDIDVILYDKRHTEKGLFALRRKIAEIRAMSFDLVISPHRSIRSAYMAWRSGAGQRIGFKGLVGSSLYTDAVDREMTCHESYRNLNLLSPLGIDSKNITPDFNMNLTDAEKQQARELFRSNWIDLDKPIAGIAPASVWRTKEWHPDGFVSVMTLLSKEYGMTPILLGGPTEAEKAEALLQRSPEGTVSLAGKTNLRTLAAVIHHCRILISNDSAPQHFASAVGTPVVTIFGPTLPEFGFTPIGVKHLLLETDNLDCRPCSIHGPQSCPKGHFKCMKNLTFEKIESELRQFLDETIG